MSDINFYQKGLMAIETARKKQAVGTLILVGGNPGFRQERQMSIYRLVSFCDQLNQHSLWFTSTSSMNAHMNDYDTGKESYAVVDLDDVLS